MQVLEVASTIGDIGTRASNHSSLNQRESHNIERSRFPINRLGRSVRSLDVTYPGIATGKISFNS